MKIIPWLVAIGATCFCVSGYGSPLTVATWGGNYADVVSAEILQPFSARFDIEVKHNLEDQSGNQTPNVSGVVELSLHDAIDACEKSEILLLPVDKLGRAASDRSVIQDFVPNSLQPCAVGHSIWSTVVAFDNARYVAEERPHLISDFFDIEFYPGKRVLRRSPKVLAEWALVASGIAPSKVYAALDDAEQAWAMIDQKLGLIEDHIVWVESDAEAIEILRTGRAAFAMLGSDSLVRNTLHGSEQLGVLWDAAVTELSLWAIPADAVDPEISWEFIRYATSVNNSGKVASFFGYGPVRYSTQKLMDREYLKMLPSWVGNQHNMLWSDSKWWQDKGGIVSENFAQWMLSIADKSELKLATVSTEITSGENESINGGVVGTGDYLWILPVTVAAFEKIN